MVVLIFVLVALLFGAGAALVGGIPVTFLLVVIVLLAIALRDYRIGCGLS